ncbi:MAG: helix-turn-helix domain-containing protein [Salibacteraceae bacterium]
MQEIPIHSFLVDDASSIPFKLIKLTKAGSYDTSVPHRHNYYEVFIFEKGGGQHFIDFESFKIKDLSIHFVSPGQVHNVVRKPDSKGFVMLFSRDFYSSNYQGLKEFPFLNNNSIDSTLNLNNSEFKVLFDLVEGIRLEQGNSEDYSDDLIKAHLNTFLIHCKRYFSSGLNDNNLIIKSLSVLYKQLIEDNYLQIHNVSEYSQMLNVSEKQLSAACKKELGVSPKELIYDRIVLEAKRLVHYTDHTFQEIAFFLSYTDASHFAKFFKSKTGFSPSEYRSRNKSTHKG